MGIYLVSLVLLYYVTHVQAVCEDLDPIACQQMAEADPYMCTDRIATFVCKAYCKMCHTQCYSCSGPIQQLNTCTQTVACASDEECYTLLELSDVHNNHTFRRGCMSKILCHPSAGTSLIGKRLNGFLTTCCDTDLCNTDHH